MVQQVICTHHHVQELGVRVLDDHMGAPAGGNVVNVAMRLFLFLEKRKGRQEK